MCCSPRAGAECSPTTGSTEPRGVEERGQNGAGSPRGTGTAWTHTRKPPLLLQPLLGKPSATHPQLTHSCPAATSHCHWDLRDCLCPAPPKTHPCPVSHTPEHVSRCHHTCAPGELAHGPGSPNLSCPGKVSATCSGTAPGRGDMGIWGRGDMGTRDEATLLRNVPASPWL